ncbi:alcohol dehydrogenase class IV [Inhella inkyongensis]|uniref:Alcohol dehydrogenase class IV n=1 Tax=Inhella inkyongensis TaxID=392593 RepID=A0A840S880_9BURK|nr:iron-containing alcohol dehydrogenase [Inhella inkyongensis]MBB5204640.1 alcohol dehydrogenase class IV [Inhella inkyongensis]
MILDLIPDAARAAGLGTLMKGAGKVTRYIPIPQPTLLVGPGSIRRLGELIAGFGHRKLLIVTDAMIVKLGLLKGLTDALDTAGTEYAVFDQITPDAPIPLIERGLAFYRDQDCDALVAVGGGSSMDAAKAIACAAANPKPLRRLAGYLKGRHHPAILYAVPTTAGTGSEVTVAAVISDPERKDKIVIVDPRLVPRVAALDPELMTGLPPAITAATGIDALTHAVEAFVGRWATPYTDGLALAAVGLIFANLRTCYAKGKDLAAREKMALASTYAGMAFTRANVGYVHAIAHQFGGRYHTPHGLANAMLLPLVMRFSAPDIVPRLAKLAVAARLGEMHERDDDLAERFLEAIEQLNRDLAIPTQLDALREEDIADIARGARAEADSGYPVPRYMTQEVCEGLIRHLLPKAPAKPAKATRAQAAPKKKTP